MEDTSHEMERNDASVFPSIHGKLVDMDLHREGMAHIFHVDDLSRISENIGSVLVEKQGLVGNLQGMLRIMGIDDGRDSSIF